MKQRTERKARARLCEDSARPSLKDLLLAPTPRGDNIFLDRHSSDAFLQALDNPPAPGSKLRKLLRRKPAWEE